MLLREKLDFRGFRSAFIGIGLSLFAFCTEVNAANDGLYQRFRDLAQVYSYYPENAFLFLPQINSEYLFTKKLEENSNLEKQDVLRTDSEKIGLKLTGTIFDEHLRQAQVNKFLLIRYHGQNYSLAIPKIMRNAFDGKVILDGDGIYSEFRLQCYLGLKDEKFSFEIKTEEIESGLLRTEVELFDGEDGKFRFTKPDLQAGFAEFGQINVSAPRHSFSLKVYDPKFILSPEFLKEYPNKAKYSEKIESVEATLVPGKIFWGHRKFSQPPFLTEKKHIVDIGHPKFKSIGNIEGLGAVWNTVKEQYDLHWYPIEVNGGADAMDHELKADKENKKPFYLNCLAASRD